jgi:hypothetical protein
MHLPTPRNTASLRETMASGIDYWRNFIPGTIYHELSHKVLNTDDVNLETELEDPDNRANKSTGTMYGVANCLLLARLKPELAVNNADNYRKFLEEFTPGGAERYTY